MLRNGSRITKKLGEYSNSLHWIVSAFDFTLYLTCNSIESLSQNMSFRKWLVDGRWTWYCGIAISNHFLQLLLLWILSSSLPSSFSWPWLSLWIMPSITFTGLNVWYSTRQRMGQANAPRWKLLLKRGPTLAYPSKLGQPPYHCLSVEREGLFFSVLESESYF